MGVTNNTMTIEEAYKLAMEAVRRLQDRGLTVRVTDSPSRNNSTTVARYDVPGRLKPDKWQKFSLAFGTEEQRDAIEEEKLGLRNAGIGFDTGGFVGVRDWEIDWSFRCDETQPPKPAEPEQNGQN